MSTPFIDSSASSAQLASTVNDLIRQVQALQTVQVFKDDAGIRRVILDKDGLRTSGEGVDVYGADNSDLTFNSNNNVFKIIDSGTVDYSINWAGQGSGVADSGEDVDTFTYDHNLGYKPFFQAYLVSAFSSLIFPLNYINVRPRNMESKAFYSYTAMASDTQLIFRISRQWAVSASGAVPGVLDNGVLSFKILQESVATS